MSLGFHMILGKDHEGEEGVLSDAEGWRFDLI
jgi:hypothetical protein